MKTLVVLLPMLTVAVIGYAGQTNQVDLKRTDTPARPPPNEQSDPLIVSRTNTLQQALRAEQKYGGALPDLKRKKAGFFKAAPANSKGGFDNVSVNPVDGRAEGIILFSINF